MLETGTCLSSLNIIVKKFSNQWKKSNFAFLTSSDQLVKVKTSPRHFFRREFTDPTRIIEDHFQRFEVQIWQKLNKKHEFQAIAQEFKTKSFHENQRIIEEIENREIKISFSQNSLKLIKTVNDYFQSASEEESRLTQAAVIIRELSINFDLIDSVEFVIDSFFSGMQSLSSRSDSVQPVQKRQSVDCLKTPNQISPRSHPVLFVKKIMILKKAFVKAKDQENEQVKQFIRTLDGLIPRNNAGTEEVIHENLKFLMKVWEIPESTANLLVPSFINTFNALKQFNFGELKDMNCSTLGQRKQWQRDTFSFFSYPTLVEGVLSLNVPFKDLSTTELCVWLRLTNLEEYVPLFNSLQITGAQLINSTSDYLKSIGISVLGHRKQLLRALNCN